MNDYELCNKAEREERNRLYSVKFASILDNYTNQLTKRHKIVEYDIY